MVLDTNVLIDGFSDDFSAQARLVEAVRDGDLAAVTTPAIKKEYRLILRRLIDDPEYRDKIEDFLWMTQDVKSQRVDVAIDDEEDAKFIRAAVGGDADIIVSNDRHLLDIGEVDGIRIMTPQEAWTYYEDQSGGSGEWQDFITGIGIGT